MISFKLFLLILSSSNTILSYTIYRVPESNQCYIYENPAFPHLPSNRIVKNRFGASETKPVIFINNRVPTDRAIYPNSIIDHNDYQQLVNSDKVPSKAQMVYYANLTPTGDAGPASNQCDQHQQNFDVYQIPKSGHFPQPSPNLNRNDGEEDEPPIVDDMLSVEKSELTEETHDLEDVEIEETYLDDAANRPKEIILETVTHLPEKSTENPATALFKKKLEEHKHAEIKKKPENLTKPDTVLDENKKNRGNDKESTKGTTENSASDGMETVKSTTSGGLVDEALLKTREGTAEAATTESVLL